MGQFDYQAVCKDGTVTRGSVSGKGRGEAMRYLQEQGMQVLSLEEARNQPPQSKASTSSAESREKLRQPPSPDSRLSSRQLIQFTEELSDLLVAGVQLDFALSSIAKRSESEALRRVAGAAHEKVSDGVTLAAALRSSSVSFSELYCNLVSAGEASGALGDILQRQVAYLTSLSELRGKLATAMVYPVFLVVSGVGVASMFTFFLIPKLRRLVESTGGELPPVAHFFLAVGELFKNHWIALLGVLAGLIVVTVVLFQRPGSRLVWHRTKLKLPLFGRLLKTRFNVQFVETLSNLLVNGLPLVKALELVRGTTPNLYVREQIHEMIDKVSEGAFLHRAMEKAGIFEPGLIDMVRIGEDTGNLASSIAKAGGRLDRELNRSIERIASIIQPAIILVMSLVVGIMAYMMISVIYETISVLRNR